MSVFVERTWTTEDHLVSLWELLEEEWIIAHKWRAPVTGTIFLSISAQGSGCGGKTNVIPQLQLRGRGSHFFLQTIFFLI